MADNLRKVGRSLNRFIVLLLLITLLLPQPILLDAANTGPRITATLNGATIQVNASGFPADAQLKSLIVWKADKVFEVFPTVIKIGSSTYSYNDQVYGYERGGKFVRTDGSGKLSFTFEFSSDAAIDEKKVQIWTEGFQANTEADAISSITTSNEAVSTTSQKPVAATTAKVSTQATTKQTATEKATTKQTTTEKATTKQTATEKATTEPLTVQQTSTTQTIVPVLRATIPQLPNTGNAELKIFYSNGSYTINNVLLEGATTEYIQTDILGTNTELVQAILSLNDDQIASWEGTLTLEKGKTQSILLKALPAAINYTVDIYLDGEKYQGNALIAKFYSEDLKTLLGEGSAKLKPGTRIAIRISTTEDGGNLITQYDFQSTVAEPIKLTVPSSDRIRVNFESQPGISKLTGLITATGDQVITIMGAHVTLTPVDGPGTGPTLTATTDTEGRFIVYGLKSGARYRIAISHPAYNAFVGDIQLTVDAIQRQNYQLKSKNSRILVAVNATLAADTNSAKLGDVVQVYAEAVAQILHNIRFEMSYVNGTNLPMAAIRQDNLDGTATYAIYPNLPDAFNFNQDLQINLISEQLLATAANVRLVADQDTPKSIQVTPKGAVIFRAVSADKAPIAGSAAAFDANTGALVYKTATTFTEADKEHLLFLNKGDYHILLIDLPYDQISAVRHMDEIIGFYGQDEYLLYKNVVVEDAKPKLLQGDSQVQHVVPRIKDSNILTLPGSWLEAPDHHSGKELVQFLGAVAVRTKTDARIKRIHVVINNAETSASAGAIPPMGFSFEGNTFPTTDEVRGNDLVQVVDFGDAGQPLGKFRFYVKPLSHEDFSVTVRADILVNGKLHTGQLIGTSQIIGLPLTLQGVGRTSKSQILLSGKGPAGETVSLLNGAILLGTALVDQRGRWQLQTALPGTTAQGPALYEIVAKTKQYISNPLTVVYDTTAPALSRVTISALEAGAEEWSGNSYYYYFQGYNYYFNAYFENADRLAEDVIFYVTCSNGEVRELATESILGDRIKSKTYNFPKENLVPVLVSVIYKEKDAMAKRQETVQLDPARVLQTITEAKQTNYQQLSDRISKNISSAGYSIKRDVQPLTTLKPGSFAIDLKYDTLSPAEILKRVGPDFKRHTSHRDNGTLLLDTYVKIESGESSIRYIGFSINYADKPAGVGTYVECLYRYALEGKTGQVSKPSSRSYQRTMTNTSRSSDSSASDIQVAGPMEIAKQHSILFPNAPAAIITKNVVMYDNVTSGLEKQGEIEQMQRTYQYMEDTLWRLRQQGIDTKRLEAMIQNGRSSSEAALETINNAAINGGFGDLVTGLTSSIDPTGIGAYGVNVISGYSGLEMDAQGEIVYNGAQGDYLEALLQFQRLTGVDRDTFIKGFESYITGSGYEIPISKQGKIPTENTLNQEAYEVVFMPKIDPSGTIYEAVLSNKLKDTKVTLYQMLNSEPVQWDGQSYDGQKNPLTSLPDGRYAWEVPEGKWLVRVMMAGYVSNDSQKDPAAKLGEGNYAWLPVLPPQLNVNIGLTSLAAPKFLSAEYLKSNLVLTFDKYLLPDSLEDGLAISDKGRLMTYGEDYTLVADNPEVSPSHTPLCGGMTLASRYSVHFKSPTSKTITLSFSDKVISYANIAMAPNMVEVPIKKPLNWTLIIIGIAITAVTLVLAVVGLRSKKKA